VAQQLGIEHEFHRNRQPGLNGARRLWCIKIYSCLRFIYKRFQSAISLIYGEIPSLPIAITQGDPAGIGPEIVAKAFRDAPDVLRGCFVVGELATLRRAAGCIARPACLELPVAVDRPLPA
jgi:hypothetical protein